MTTVSEHTQPAITSAPAVPANAVLAPITELSPSPYAAPDVTIDDDHATRYMWHLAIRAGYDAHEVDDVDIRALAYWWSPEGEHDLREPAVAIGALRRITAVLERLPEGKAFARFVDKLHAETVSSGRTYKTYMNRAVTLWTRMQWHPGANGILVVGLDRELSPVTDAYEIEALGALGIKYRNAREMYRSPDSLV